MARQLHVYLDGTWNNPSLATNVFKLFGQVPGPEQIVPDGAGVRDHRVREAEGVKAFYLVGVGAEGDHKGVLEGALGLGLHRRVIDAFVLLSRHYQRGDKIWVFGFSRGAWSARALAGLIGRAGLLPPDVAQARDAQAAAEKLWLDSKHSQRSTVGDAFWAAQGDASPIRMVGVWDTVGALGIPFFNGLRSIDQIEKNLFDFADLALSPRVELGRHALAIDERRVDFSPTLWKAREGVVQAWFAGAHADVGGGYTETGLSDIALRWMAEQAIAAGAALNALPDDLRGDPRGPRHDESVKPAFLLRPREARKVSDSSAVHTSVLTRLETEPGYRPEALRPLAAFKSFFSQPASAQSDPLASEGLRDWGRLDAVGQSKANIKVFAGKWWNATLLAVQHGERYRLTAEGDAMDADQHSGPDGYASGGNWKLKLLESTRRLPDVAWFKLVAAVHPDKTLEAHNADSGNLVVGSLESLTHSVGQRDEASSLRVAVGSASEITVPQDGYLYLYVNDSAFAYANNKQNLTVCVTRLA